ncbi:MAG: methyltransferase domain-containing protein [Myxococcota bacterium]
MTRIQSSPIALLFLVSTACGSAAPTPASGDPGGEPVASAPAGHDQAARGKHGHDKGHSGHKHNFDRPEVFAERWNAPERDSYQKPEEILAALAIQPGQTVVDLGAGTGYLLPRLARAVGPTGTVIALDVEPAMVRYLDEAAARAGWSNVETHLGAPDDPRLDRASVDRVVTLNVWHHIDGRPAYARRLAAALKPGAVVVVVDFLRQETEGPGPPMNMRLSAEQVIGDLEAAGFRAETVAETMPRHYVVRAVLDR